MPAKTKKWAEMRPLMMQVGIRSISILRNDVIDCKNQPAQPERKGVTPNGDLLF
jgi:hypothetical protein